MKKWITLFLICIAYLVGVFSKELAGLELLIMFLVGLFGGFINNES